MFDNTDVPLGVRVEFFFQWSKWIKNINKRVQLSSKANETPQSNETPLSNESSQSNTQTSAPDNSNASSTSSNTRMPAIVNDINIPSTSSFQKPINLHDILKSNSYGRNVMEVIQINTDGNTTEKPELNENLRKLLCESVLQYCIQYKHDLSKRDCASLTAQICTAFPNELAVLHYYLLIRFFFLIFIIIIV